MPTEHDPFAPHNVGGPYADDPDGFPARRLARAGLPDDAVGNLRAWYAQASPDQQAEWRGTIHSARDDAIRGRFVAPGGDLEHLTKEQLAELLRAAGQPVTGNKPDLIARLTAETPPGPPQGPEGAGEGEEAEEGATGGQGQPGGADNAPEGQAPQGQAPQGAPGPPPNEELTTAEPQTGAQQPPDPAEEATPQGQPGAPQQPPQEPSHEPPVTAPTGQPAHESRRSTPRRPGGTGPGART